MANHSWSKFFWGDWDADPALNLCEPGAQALWMKLLAIAARHDPQGYVAINGKPLSNDDIVELLRWVNHPVNLWLNQLEDRGVFSRDERGCIFSRRMVRDAESYEMAVKFGKKGGNPNILKRKPKKNGLSPPLTGPLTSNSNPPVKGPVNIEAEAEAEAEEEKVVVPTKTFSSVKEKSAASLARLKSLASPLQEPEKEEALEEEYDPDDQDNIPNHPWNQHDQHCFARSQFIEQQEREIQQAKEIAWKAKEQAEEIARKARVAGYKAEWKRDEFLSTFPIDGRSDREACVDIFNSLTNIEKHLAIDKIRDLLAWINEAPTDPERAVPTAENWLQGKQWIRFCQKLH